LGERDAASMRACSPIPVVLALYIASFSYSRSPTRTSGMPRRRSTSFQCDSGDPFNERRGFTTDLEQHRFSGGAQSDSTLPCDGNSLDLRSRLETLFKSVNFMSGISTTTRAPKMARFFYHARTSKNARPTEIRLLV